MNVTTQPKGIGEAVLIRAVEPVRGEEVMRENRGPGKPLADGPGKLCQALEITGAENGLALNRAPLFITGRVDTPRWEATPRIGIDYASTRDELWRFVEQR